MEMQDEDRPPEEIWLNDEELADHFDRVREKYRSGSGGSEEVPEYEQNELTKGLR